MELRQSPGSVRSDAPSRPLLASQREDRILNCLGRMPEKPDNPDVRVLEVHNMGTHERKLIEYSVEPGERITAWLLVPMGMEEGVPAIVACHQHAGEYYLGKSEPAGLTRNSMYHYGLDLCLRGYVVLCPDHLGFEDRRPKEFLRRENGALEDAQYERFLLCQYIANGSTLQAKYLSDLTVAVDVLGSLPVVDANRIGAIGHSLGGQETLWLTWFDHRIKAAVSSCGFGQIQSILRDHVAHNLAMFTFDFLNQAGDVHALVKGIAPRAFLMTNGTEDPLFPMDGVYDIIANAETHFAEMGVPERFKAVVFQEEHCFPKEIREDAYHFLDRFLKEGEQTQG